jgi:hypothetical protein
MRYTPIGSHSLFIAVLFVVALCLPLPALAVSTVTISSGGDGVFSVQGTGIEDAAALEITIMYDTNTLASPRVVEGTLIAGAMTAINQSIPGMVRMVIIRLTPISGSGVIATLSFDRTGSSPGIVRSMSVRLADIKGAPLSALAQVSNPQDAAANVAASSQDQNISSGSTTTTVLAGTPSAPYIIPSTVIIAGQQAGADEMNKAADTTRAREQDSQPSTPDAAGSAVQEPAAPGQKTEPVVTADAVEISRSNRKTATVYTQKSVLDRFKEYKGERTIAAMLSLFENESMIGCRQEPSVAISDGKSIVRVVFLSTPGANPASDLSVTGARLISLSKDPDNTNTWIAELVPEKGAYRAGIAVSQGELKMIFPLAVSPKTDVYHVRPGTWTDADFLYYLKRQRTDLNGDGKRDYLDDYLFTANYIDGVRKTRSPRQGSAATMAGQ